MENNSKINMLLVSSMFSEINIISTLGVYAKVCKFNKAHYKQLLKYLAEA